MEMSKANSDLAKGQLLELTQEAMHVIQAYNEAKVVLEVEFDWVWNEIMIMESRIRTEKVRINSVVSQVESIMQPQQAVLQEPWCRFQILRCQDDERVSKATNLCAGIRQESKV